MWTIVQPRMNDFLNCIDAAAIDGAITIFYFEFKNGGLREFVQLEILKALFAFKHQRAKYRVHH